MTTKKAVVRVTIMGDEYSIRTDATPDHTRAVAEYVDQAIREVMQGSNVHEPHKAAILAALQITDELFKVRRASHELEDGIRDLGAEVRRWLPPAKRGEGVA